jgi:HEPN domain-containing protein
MPSASSPSDLHIANNLRLGRGDLADAQQLLKSRSRNAAYLAQQAVEKLLLAILVSENLERARAESHRLDILVDKLPKNNRLRERLSQLSYLTVFATTFRYPKDGGRLPPDPNWDRLAQSLALAGELIDEASRHFGVDLAGSDRVPAARIDPIR